MTKTRVTKFEKLCTKVGESLGIDVIFFYEQRPDEPNEDDGNLHITKLGVRAVFDVGRGQDAEAAEQNDRTEAVLKALNMEHAIGYWREHTA